MMPGECVEDWLMDRPTYLFVPARTEWGDSVGDNSGGRILFNRKFFLFVILVNPADIACPKYITGSNPDITKTV